MTKPLNTPRRSLLLGLASLALAACTSGPEISRVDDPEVDFGAFRTFAFAPNDGPDSLLDRRLLGAARRELEERGYVYDVLEPDLLVVIAAEVEEPHGARVSPGSVTAAGIDATDDQRLGRLVVHLVDVRRRRVVWQGSAKGRVTPAMLREPGVAVERAVAVVFQGFTGHAPPVAPRKTPDTPRIIGSADGLRSARCYSLGETCGSLRNRSA